MEDSSFLDMVMVNRCTICQNKEKSAGGRLGSGFQGENDFVFESEVLVVHMSSDI